jgi:spermidine/putrescine-binding protein
MTTRRKELFAAGSKDGFVSGSIPVRLPSCRIVTAALAAVLVAIALTGSPAKADEAQWDAMVAAAKKEGSVRVSLPNGLPNLGAELAKPFEQQFGITLNAATDNTSIQMRVEQEANAHKQSVDVILSGAGELLGLYPEKLLAPIKPLLVAPETIDPTKWRDGEIKWIDDAQQYMPMSSEWVHLDLVVNADIVKPSDITSWRDLLDPKYKGKIIALMPTLGAGGATARADRGFRTGLLARSLPGPVGEDHP